MTRYVLVSCFLVDINQGKSRFVSREVLKMIALCVEGMCVCIILLSATKHLNNRKNFGNVNNRKANRKLIVRGNFSPQYQCPRLHC